MFACCAPSSQHPVSPWPRRLTGWWRWAPLQAGPTCCSSYSSAACDWRFPAALAVGPSPCPAGLDLPAWWPGGNGQASSCSHGFPAFLLQPLSPGSVLDSCGRDTCICVCMCPSELYRTSVKWEQNLLCVHWLLLASVEGWKWELHPSWGGNSCLSF